MTLRRRSCMIVATWSSRCSSGWSAGTDRICCTTGPGSNAASVAAQISASLLGKTRKIVPSATPAASAIWRVETWAPCWRISARVEPTMAARRCSGAIGAARPLVEEEPYPESK